MVLCIRMPLHATYSTELFLPEIRLLDTTGVICPQSLITSCLSSLQLALHRVFLCSAACGSYDHSLVSGILSERFDLDVSLMEPY